MKQAGVITVEMEGKLWSGFFLGDSNPRLLSNTLLYLLGLNFTLRIVQDYRGVTGDQLRLKYK